MDAGDGIGMACIGGGALAIASSFMPASMAGTVPGLSGISPHITFMLGIGAMALGAAFSVCGKDIGNILGGGSKGKPSVKRPASLQPQTSSSQAKR